MTTSSTRRSTSSTRRSTAMQLQKKFGNFYTITGVNISRLAAGREIVKISKTCSFLENSSSLLGLANDVLILFCPLQMSFIGLDHFIAARSVEDASHAVNAI